MLKQADNNVTYASILELNSYIFLVVLVSLVGMLNKLCAKTGHKEY